MVLLAAAPARAMVFEEFEVFVPPAAEPGSVDVEQHVNYGFRGRTRMEEERALPTERGLYFNTEIGIGVTPWYMLALEIPLAVTADGAAHQGGLKLRNLFRFYQADGWSFGLLAELQNQPRGFLPHPWGIAAGPLIAWQGGRWQAVLNLTTAVSFGERGSESGFFPAARLMYTASEHVAVGLEYYGDVGRLERWERGSEQGHQIFAITELGLGALHLRLGIGRGLTPASDRWVGTMVLGFDF